MAAEDRIYEQTRDARAALELDQRGVILPPNRSHAALRRATVRAEIRARACTRVACSLKRACSSGVIGVSGGVLLRVCARIRTCVAGSVAHTAAIFQRRMPDPAFLVTATYLVSRIRWAWRWAQAVEQV